MAAQQLPPECSRLMGYVIPTSRPTAQQNQFVDLYSADGKALVLDSEAAVRRLVGDGMGAAVLESLQLTYPVRVELNFPWCIGSPPGRNLDVNMQAALAYQLNGVNGTLSRCDDADMQKCVFTERCCSPEAQREFLATAVAIRIQRQAEAVAPFPAPYCVTFWVKTKVDYYNSETTGQEMERQTWGPWQFCTNCYAVRSVSFCGHWFRALKNEELLKERVVPKGTQSDLDVHPRDSRRMTEAILARDKHTYA